MKFVTYRKTSSEAPRTGLRLSDSLSAEQSQLRAAGLIVDLERGSELLRALQDVPPPAVWATMISVIENQDLTLPVCRALEKHFLDKKLPNTLLTPESAVELLAPIPRPLSMRDGYAFRQHVESARKGRGLPMIPEFDHFPIFYYTNHLQVTGPGDVLVQVKAQERLDYELEVAVVIGREGKNIKASEADAHIFGYLIMNDWSARELQTQEMKLNLGPAKGKDFATSLGPYLVTRDELTPHALASPQGERHALQMRAWLNDKQVAEDNLKNMTWTFGQILERASYGVTLHPGEVIGSGTCGTGCFMETNATGLTQNLWIKPGDRMVIEVEGLGRLENRIVDGGA